MTNQKYWPVRLVLTKSRYEEEGVFESCFLQENKGWQDLFSPTLQICPFALGRWWVCTLCRGESLQMRRRSCEERGACVQQLLSRSRLDYSRFKPNHTWVHPPPHYGITTKSGYLGLIWTHSALRELLPQHDILWQKVVAGQKKCNVPSPWDLETEFSVPCGRTVGSQDSQDRGKSSWNPGVNLKWTRLLTCWVVSQLLSCFATSGFVVTQISAS